MASSAPHPKDWRPVRDRFLVAGAVAGIGYALWARPPWLGASTATSVPGGAALGVVAGFLVYLAFRVLIRRLYRAFAPKMRPDRLS